MLNPSARGSRKIILLAAAMLVAGTSISFAQGGGAGGAGGADGAGGAAGSGGAAGGAGGARGGSAVPATPPSAPSAPSASPSVVNPSNPSTVPQQSSTPANPSTPSTPSITTSSGGVTSPGKEETRSTAARSKRASVAKARSVHRHRGRVAEGALGSYYCGSSPCVRIYLSAIYSYAAPAHGVVAPALRASALWWPGYYDYAPGEWGRGHPRYGGYGRRAGYHGD
jgi:hypothetical protein